MAKVSRTTVTQALGRLQELGELVVDARPGRTNEYRIVLPGVGQYPAGSDGGGRNPADHPATPLADTRPPVRPRSIPEPSSDPSAATAAASSRKTDPRADEITRAWWDTREPKPLQPYVAIRGIVNTALKAKWPAAEVLAALTAIGDDPPVVGWKLEKALAARRPKRSAPGSLNWDR